MSRDLCPLCGDRFKHVTKHWQQGNCPYPQIPDAVNDVVRGLILAGSRYRVPAQNPVISTDRRSQELIDWLDSRLDWLSNGYSRHRRKNGDTYELRTKAHPGLDSISHIAAGKLRKEDISPVSLAVWRSIKGSTQTQPSGYEEVRLPLGYCPVQKDDLTQVLSENSIKANGVEYVSDSSERGRACYISVPKPEFTEFVDSQYRYDGWRTVPGAPPQK